VNGSRYLNKNSPCPECDGSGVIKFPGQKPRPCKICALTKTKKTMTRIIKPKYKNTKPYDGDKNLSF
jgi:DnaJ-class molecular chaperone